MKKIYEEADQFFKKSKSIVSREFSKNSENSNPEVLDSSESDKISEIFSEVEPVFSKEILLIKQLTGQIKGIQKQGVLLVGEKIFRIREILKEIGCLETSFSKWISLVFPTKSSAYNALAYYELYINLPNQVLKQKFQSIPYKTAYILASRRADIKKKISVMEIIQGMGNENAITTLNQFIPSARNGQTGDKERDPLDYLIYKKAYDLMVLIKKSPKLSTLSKKILREIFLISKNS
ncbi:CT583 family protein [Chlamydiifrater phoenicopteri]|uniref:CT583 family protein n=1 Tax=Chlamydiifrater phoenicopteri TaxID=2681469 RepID=UPI001BCB4723|nr:CT583 family protein [Chlamydiifrater phoenicopteri]